MKRIKEWLINKFLPAWAKDSLYKEIQALRERIAEQDAEIMKLNAYISGLEVGLRAQRRVIINNEVSKQ